MSKVRDPVEKKRLAYARDHYNRGGQHDKGWRKIKPLKKMKARRAFREGIERSYAQFCGRRDNAHRCNSKTRRIETVIWFGIVVAVGYVHTEVFLAGQITPAQDQ